MLGKCVVITHILDHLVGQSVNVGKCLPWRMLPFRNACLSKYPPHDVFGFQIKLCCWILAFFGLESILATFEKFVNFFFKSSGHPGRDGQHVDKRTRDRNLWHCHPDFFTIHFSLYGLFYSFCKKKNCLFEWLGKSFQALVFTFANIITNLAADLGPVAGPVL